MIQTFILLWQFTIGYLLKDENRLMKVYKSTLKRQERYILSCNNPFEKSYKLTGLIIELLEMIELNGKEKEPFFLKGEHLFNGIKIKHKIIGAKYIEVWIRSKVIWIYMFTRDEEGKVEKIYPYHEKITNVINKEEIYYALKKFV